MQIKLFLYFEFELRIAHSFCQKTVWTGVKFLDGSFFVKSNLNQFSVFRTPLVINTCQIGQVF